MLNEEYLNNTFRDIDFLEKELHSIFDCDNIAIFDEDSDDGYLYIDDIIKIEHKDGCWGLYYCREYGPLDKYIIFEIEEHALFGYQCLKKCFSKKPQLFHNKDYPSSETLVGFLESKLSKKFIKDFSNCVKIISNYYYGDAYKKNERNEYTKIIEETHKTFFLDLTFMEYLEMQSELEYISCFIYLTVLGFSAEGDQNNFHSIYKKSIYTKGELKVALTEILLYEADYFEIIEKKKPKAELYVELNNYLVLVYNDQKYIVEKEGYLLIEYLINEYNDSFQDGTEISFFITDKFELIINNSLFSVVQRAYITEKLEKTLLNYEIKELEKKLHLLKGEKYFEIGDIIRKFETLINCDTTQESELEEFIKINYKVLLGKEYSKIKTQIMIDYVSRDNYEERRFDVFAFNSVSKEWELFELKKSNIKIIKKIRGIPMFNSNVNNGIAQLRYYKNMITQESVCRVLKEKYEIDIKIPKFTLLIGSDNSDDLKICQNEVLDIRIQTYSQLIEKAKIEIS